MGPSLPWMLCLDTQGSTPGWTWFPVGHASRTPKAFSRLKGENSTKYSKRNPCLCLWANLASESPFQEASTGHQPPSSQAAPSVLVRRHHVQSCARAVLWPRCPVGDWMSGVPLKRLEGAHGRRQGCGAPSELCLRCPCTRHSPRSPPNADL